MITARAMSRRSPLEAALPRLCWDVRVLLDRAGDRVGWIPWVLTRWRIEPPLLGLSVGRWSGGALIALGVIVVVECFARFALVGLGTPAPVAPTKHLVVTGLYRQRPQSHVHGRSDGHLGRGPVAREYGIGGYAALVWLLFFGFVLLHEEPALRRRYGSSCHDYRAHLPRWWPRIRLG